jgi:hypothetical protein
MKWKMVRSWLLGVQAHVQSQDNSCQVCGGQSGTRIDFSSDYFCFPSWITVPPFLPSVTALRCTDPTEESERYYIIGPQFTFGLTCGCLCLYTHIKPSERSETADKWLIRFTFRPNFPRGKNTRHLIGWELCGQQCLGGEDKNSIYLLPRLKFRPSSP